jgi:hypothetical protein
MKSKAMPGHRTPMLLPRNPLTASVDDGGPGPPWSSHNPTRHNSTVAQLIRVIEREFVLCPLFPDHGIDHQSGGKPIAKKQSTKNLILFKHIPQATAAREHRKNGQNSRVSA